MEFDPVKSGQVRVGEDFIDDNAPVGARPRGPRGAIVFAAGAPVFGIIVVRRRVDDFKRGSDSVGPPGPGSPVIVDEILNAAAVRCHQGNALSSIVEGPGILSCHGKSRAIARFKSLEIGDNDHVSSWLEVDDGKGEGDPVRELHAVQGDCAVADIGDLDEFKISTTVKAGN